MNRLEELLGEWENLDDDEKDNALEIMHTTLTAWRDGEASSSSIDTVSEYVRRAN